MKHFKIGPGGNVHYTVLTFRIMLPYGRVISRSSYFAILNFEKKVLVNTGAIENQSEIKQMLESAGLTFHDIDYVFNMTSKPEHIGLNTVVQYENPGTVFFTHPMDVHYIEDTVFQHESRYVPGFYKIVSGNTQGVRALHDGQEIDLGGEIINVSFNHYDENNGGFSLKLARCGVHISGREIKADRNNIKKAYSDIATYNLSGSA